jgi:transcriptional regulator with XRE-family HTH domain
MKDLPSLGNAIKFLRSRKNISARGLSTMCGLSPSYIGKVESGSLAPSFDAFCSISAALDMTDNEMLFLVKLNQRIVSENIRKDLPS